MNSFAQKHLSPGLTLLVSIGLLVGNCQDSPTTQNAMNDAPLNDEIRYEVVQVKSTRPARTEYAR